MRIRNSIIATAVAGSMVVGINSPAGAQIPMDTSSPAATSHYTDEEIVGIFAFGSGKAANEHPDLAAKFVPATAPKAPEKLIESFTKDLMAVDNKFHSLVTVAVQSHDPYQTRDALIRMTNDIRTYQASVKVHQRNANASETEAGRGKVKVGLNVVASINVAAGINAVVWANVAAATEVAVAAFVVFAAGIVLTYKFDNTKTNEFDRTAIVADIVTGM